MKNIRRVNETFLITVIIALVASFTFGYIPAIRNYPLLNILLSQAIYVIPMIVYLVYSKTNIRELLRIKKVSIPNVVLLVVFSYFIMPLLAFLNSLSLMFTESEISDTITGIVSSCPLIVSILAVAVIPAILEESVYRGVFFNEYRKVDPLKGLILSGLLFGLMHMNFNQFIYAFVMGMIFALVVEITDSIVGSMIVHFTINGSSVVLNFLLPKLQSLAGEIGDGSQVGVQSLDSLELSKEVLLPVVGFYGVLAIFGTVIAFFILKGIAQIAKRPEVFQSIVRRTGRKFDKFDFLPMVLGVFICIGIMIYQQIM